nr:hypothetical protein [Tanacetum cinerariifolium]
MIAEPGDGERDVYVNETFHEQTDDELSERELKQIEADDQAIQTILLGLPEDIYAAVDRGEGQVVQRKLTDTCNKRSNGYKLSWEISRVNAKILHVYQIPKTSCLRNLRMRMWN